jgi:signal transduction histidine kinase
MIFGQLPYGAHLLRIRAMDAEGRWFTEHLDIPIHVLPPFYFRPWFLLLCSVALVLSIWSYSYRYRRTRQLRRQRAELQAEAARCTRTIKQQAQELRSLDQLKTKFFTNVSQELRTPLSLLKGPVNSLLRQAHLQGKDRPLLLLLQRNTNHLLRLVNEILDLAKLEGGRMEIQEGTLYLPEFFQNLVAQFSSVGDSQSVRLRLDDRVDNTLYLLMDMGKLEKIVHNFHSNALKFTAVGKQVERSVSEEADHLLIRVSDEGPGFRPDDLPRIFDRFFQSHDERLTAAWGGTGTGLSLCRELAELLGGKVWAVSQVGEGGTFFLRLPRRISKAAQTLPRVPSGEADALESPATMPPRATEAAYPYPPKSRPGGKRSCWRRTTRTCGPASP